MLATTIACPRVKDLAATELAKALAFDKYQ